MELKLGKMTQKELADWFGISYNTLKTNPKTKANKLEILKTYADYHFEGKSVCIDKIYIPEYSRAYSKVEELFAPSWNKSGIDSCANVGRKIYNSSVEVSSQIKLKTTQTYVGCIKRQRYGRNHMNEYGTCGKSEFAWAKVVDGETVPVSEEEARVIRQCSKEIYGEQLGERIAFLHTALKANEITKEEFVDGISYVKDDCCMMFYNLVEERLGFIPERLTKLIDKEASAF